ncbi:hsp70 family protein [Pelagicoccus albus]|uniref:Hsp70 family protein n=1 Tax=Pelagicoccus albus TaxID=415222 RepID=A0A7X1EA44_9BACT|nr:hsp70 family protein [Pelagicoccus albus]MBC2606412.1 Hsp70 family protein [Pelagicoccus albus]
MAGFPRYSIGIDLGTTNCSLAYVDLSRTDGESQVLMIPQLEQRATEVERTSLPSFLAYESEGRWLVGAYAKRLARETPDLVAHSAKSWLGNLSLSPSSGILPWKSRAVPESEKLTPMGASALLLATLRDAWNRKFGESAPFGSQSVVITVPASFDPASQAATLQAAKQAGYPAGVRIVEEPQAAFYRWLESQSVTLSELEVGSRILVVDVGGGTSDFSLFSVARDDDGTFSIKRESVSEHLLLGGDNMDLALSYALESELVGASEELSVDQWGFLLSRARELKEASLEAESDGSFKVAIPSKGAGLLAGTLSAEISLSQARELVLEGFYPLCSAGTVAEKAQEGMREWGLPYAVDCAVTHHISEFLGAEPRVDAVLFNGGSLSTTVVQQRLLELLANWQGGETPFLMASSETDLAVARGAAYFGALSYRKERVIDSGASRCVLLKLAIDERAEYVCVLPKGAQPLEVFVAEVDGLHLQLNKVARFEAALGDADMSLSAGERRFSDASRLRTLPALETEVEMDGSDSVPVRLRACLNELGLVTVVCESTDPEREGEWELEFNLRGDVSVATTASTQADKGVQAYDLKRAQKAESILLGRLFSKDPNLKASRIFKELESSLALPKPDWNLPLCRALIDGLLAKGVVPVENNSALEAWFQLAGYLMRPGFGTPRDRRRLDLFFELLGDPAAQPRRVEVQQLIFLRRVCFGLSEEEQASLFDKHFELLIGSPKSEPERIRLLCSLEAVDLERKGRLFEELSQRLRISMQSSGEVGSFLTGMAILLSRLPFRTGLDRVVPPNRVETIFGLLKKEDWTNSRFAGAKNLFLRAGRIVDDRHLDLSSGLARKIRSKLEKSGVEHSKLRPLEIYVARSVSDQNTSFGEALPPGLVLV